MLSNPPYGKSWKTDLERMGGKSDIQDQRFVVEHAGDTEFSLITRSNDGQLMFLVNKLSKMKRDTPLGSRIAEVHNGSSLFTGDAGQGESNIRRWIIENDWLEAIIALPLNMFYNTGIATYIWVISNRKPKKRKGKVQLIDATSISTPLRKNLGKKNCEFSEIQIDSITKLFLNFKPTDVSKIFPNDEFGYWKIVVERPLRLTTHITKERLNAFKATAAKAWLEPVELLVKIVGMDKPHRNFNEINEQFEASLKEAGIVLRAAALKNIYDSFTEKDPEAEPIIKKKTKKAVVYEPDPELRDTEQVPLLEVGGIEAFFKREVLPHFPDAWIDESKTLIGYEISFTRHFYRPQPLRTLNEIRVDLQNLQTEAEGLLDRIVAMGAS
jgi:type I restriction enzyme M protein